MHVLNIIFRMIKLRNPAGLNYPVLDAPFFQVPADPKYVLSYLMK